jgi:hypothetical protein
MNKITEIINDLDSMIERAITIKENFERGDPKTDISLLINVIKNLHSFQNKLIGYTKQ